jgi:hypothetical protein
MSVARTSLYFPMSVALATRRSNSATKLLPLSALWLLVLYLLHPALYGCDGQRLFCQTRLLEELSLFRI